MQKNKDKITHGFFNNISFMYSEQWRFEKKAFLFPVLYIIFDLIVSLITIWLPKVVLDMVSQSVSASAFVINICTLTIVLMICKYAGHFTQQEHLKCTVKILNMHFYIEKDWKILDMDYSLATSPEGKIKIEKGHSTTNRNIRINMASFYPNITELIRNVLGMFAYSAIILLLNPLVIIILLISYLIDAYVSYLILKWEHSINDKRAKINNKFYYILEDINNNAFAKDIRAYNMKGWLDHTARSFIKEKSDLETQVQTKYFLRTLLGVILYIIRNGGGYAFLIWRMMSTSMSIGDFILYFGAITGFSQWLDQIVTSFRKLTDTNFLIDDYRNLTDTKDILKRDEGASLPACDEAVELVLDNVCFRYDNSDRDILSNINLVINKGEKLAIVGANGAGKTTLIKLICGLLQPVSGRILMNGTDIREFNRDEYYSLIAAVFQNVSLLPMSIAQNITFVQESEQNKDKLNSVINKAGLADKISQLPEGYNTCLLPNITAHGVNLSGGEIQKLALARALYKDAPLLILDEPTAALDPIAENMMYQRYNELTKNKTSIFISHRLSSTRFCDRIIYLEDGYICEIGTHDELMAIGGKYKEVFDIQSHYYKDNNEENVI
jgi:ABC-type multidrug transport system fused ATPase/permease subunit